MKIPRNMNEKNSEFVLDCAYWLGFIVIMTILISVMGRLAWWIK